MTEAQWLACTNSGAMAVFVAERTSSRKLRLFAVACCRQLWHLLPDDLSKHVVEVVERFADGDASELELAEANRLATTACEEDRIIPRDRMRRVVALCTSQPHSPGVRCYPVSGPADAMALPVLEAVSGALMRETIDEEMLFAAEHAAAIALASALRDITGNPFRPVAFSSSWRTDTALALARQMYESRDFGAMPILADALQDAGCDNPDILNHCRDTKPVHVRGCWVVDLVLGKA